MAEVRARLADVARAPEAAGADPARQGARDPGAGGIRRRELGRFRPAAGGLQGLVLRLGPDRDGSAGVVFFGMAATGGGGGGGGGPWRGTGTSYPGCLPILPARAP